MKLNELQVGTQYKVQGRYQPVVFASLERFSKKRISRWNDDYVADPKGMYLQTQEDETVKLHNPGYLSYGPDFVHVTKIECLWSEHEESESRRFVYQQKVDAERQEKQELQKQASVALQQLLGKPVSEYSTFNDKAVLAYLVGLLERQVSLQGQEV